MWESLKSVKNETSPLSFLLVGCLVGWLIGWLVFSIYPSVSYRCGTEDLSFTRIQGLINLHDGEI